MIRTLGRLVDAVRVAEKLATSYENKIELLAMHNSRFDSRPRIYFEEWYDPIISGIGWVSELIQIAGGEDCFSDLSAFPDAKSRIIDNPQRVIERSPDIIIGSWCGRRFHPQQVAERAGWQSLPAVVNGQIYEIKSTHILQPGPAALTDGLDELARIIKDWHKLPATS